jgi:uncharacterized protein YjiS (DUF1127 family)
MTTFDHAARSPAAGHAATRPAITARLVSVVVRNYRAWQNRRAFYRLGDMTDIELADIGLRRSDLSVAVDLAGGGDPTTHLGTLVRLRTRELDGAARLR